MPLRPPVITGNQGNAMAIYQAYVHLLLPLIWPLTWSNSVELLICDAHGHICIIAFIGSANSV